MLEIVLILASAASGLEMNFSGVEMRQMAVDVWRIAALLAVDLHLMAEIGRTGQRGREMMAFWQAEDDFFLRPQTMRMTSLPTESA